MKINKNSLQARINNLSKEKDVPANTILQEYFFDAFLKRVAKSKYHENFVFKGGFLLSATFGIDLRATLDVDFLLRNLGLTEENIRKTFEEIIKVEVDDNVIFNFANIKPIRQDDEYGGYNVSLLGHLENIKVTVNIDVATGDPITPNSIVYEYKCLFDNDVLNFSAYNFETIVAEKLQTVLKRGPLNSRCKDFYDLHIIHKLKWNEINIKNLKEAFINTCNYRHTIFSKEDATLVVNSLKDDTSMLPKWISYQKKNKFASDVQFDDAINSIISIISIIYG